MPRHWLLSAFLPSAAAKIDISDHLLPAGPHQFLILSFLQFSHLSLFPKRLTPLKIKITPNFKLNSLLNFQLLLIFSSFKDFGECHYVVPQLKSFVLRL